MLFVVVCLCFAACALGAPTATDVVPLEKQQPTVIPIVSQSDELEPNGTYHFSYETGNGIKRDEISYSKVVPKTRGLSADSNEGGEDSGSDEIHVQMGSYSYTAPDGTLISVRYIADENGFQPVGDHIPRVPSASGSSSGEKSGRALKVADSVSSASAPATAKAAEKSSVAVPLSATVEGTKLADSANATSTVAPTESGEASTKTDEAKSEPSTTEAAKLPEASSANASVTTETSTTEAAKAKESAATEKSATDAETSSAKVTSTTVAA